MGAEAKAAVQVAIDIIEAKVSAAALARRRRTPQHHPPHSRSTTAPRSLATPRTRPSHAPPLARVGALCAPQVRQADGGDFDAGTIGSGQTASAAIPDGKQRLAAARKANDSQADIDAIVDKLAALEQQVRNHPRSHSTTCSTTNPHPLREHAPSQHQRPHSRSTTGNTSIAARRVRRR